MKFPPDSLEDGDPCPYPDCKGMMHFPPVQSCYCHIKPPCSACVDQTPECTECGFKLGDDCSHEWEYRDDSFDHEFGTEIFPPYEKCLLCEKERPYEAPTEY